MTVKTVTREKYDQMTRNDYAGTTRTLLPRTFQGWAELHPSWKGQHWGMWFENGTVLGPMNVEPQL